MDFHSIIARFWKYRIYKMVNKLMCPRLVFFDFGLGGTYNIGSISFYFYYFIVKTFGYFSFYFYYFIVKTFGHFHFNYNGHILMSRRKTSGFNSIKYTIYIKFPICVKKCIIANRKLNINEIGS